jgi:CRP/FNR family transcriptional regulator, cyclic AMP receptor protein
MTSSDSLAGLPLVGGLTEEQRAKVAGTAREVTFAARERLFDEGQPAHACWLIRSGRIVLDTVVPGRGAIVVQTLGPGDVVGWSWLVPPRRWHFGAVAAEEVAAVELDTDRLKALADEDPALGYPLVLGLFESVLQRLQSTRGRLLDLYGRPRDR